MTQTNEELERILDGVLTEYSSIGIQSDIRKAYDLGFQKARAATAKGIAKEFRERFDWAIRADGNIDDFITKLEKIRG